MTFNDPQEPSGALLQNLLLLEASQSTGLLLALQMKQQKMILTLY